MPRGPATRKADLDRVLKALADAGMAPAKVIVRPGGEIEITPGPRPKVGDLQAPPLTPEPAPGQVDDLDAWRQQRDRRAHQGS